jgi:hypothetical protein
LERARLVRYTKGVNSGKNSKLKRRVLMFKTLISFAVFVLFLSVPANAATYFTGNLNAAQETPPNASTATGFGRVTLNEAQTQITVSVWYGSAAAPLTGNVTMGHIHTGAVGVSGPVTFDLAPPGGSTFGVVTNKIFAINATQLADLKAGNMYFNIHTVNNPTGEIRGQLALDSPYVAYMDGNQRVPSSLSTATGSAAVSVNEAGAQAIVSMNWTGLSSNAFDGIMRQGRSGQGPTGGFFCDLLVPAISSGTSGDVLCHFTPVEMTALRQGQMYVHIITDMGTTSEIRGQVQRRRSTVVDFDGDGKTDYAIARNVGSAIVWWISNSGDGGNTILQFGVADDFNTQRIMPCDFDGDGKDDMAIWRSSVSQTGFLVHQSSTGTVVFQDFGITGDDPRVVNDYDGDGRCDPAVYRGGASATWFYRRSANNTAGNITFVSWGGTGDFANPGDFNGDGRADFRVQDGSNWWTLMNGTFTSDVRQFGTSVMFGTPGDYDGDGKIDLAGTLSEGGNLAWYYVSTLTPNQNLYLTRREWGPSAGTRTRAQGDYDGDGKSDYAVWIEAAPTGFWVLPSNGSPFTFFNWGTNGTPDDFAIAGYNNR